MKNKNKRFKRKKVTKVYTADFEHTKIIVSNHFVNPLAGKIVVGIKYVNLKLQ